MAAHGRVSAREVAQPAGWQHMAVCLQGRWRNPQGGSTWPCVCKGGGITRTRRVAAHGHVSAREVAQPAGWQHMAVCLQGRWRNLQGGRTWPCVCKGGGVTRRVAEHGRVSAREVAQPAGWQHMAVCLQGRWHNPQGGSTWPCVCKGGGTTRRVAAHGRVSALGSG